jgi:hypothetical protein
MRDRPVTFSSTAYAHIMMEIDNSRRCDAGDAA